MIILENIKMALKNLGASKVRSFLTMLGIIIGISSVITIVSLGQGARDSIIGQFEKIGATLVTITVDPAEAESSDYINQKDIDAIKEKLATVKYITAQVQVQGILTAGKFIKNASISGGSEDTVYISNYTMTYGRFYNKNDVQNFRQVAVIDETVATNIFGKKDVVGQTIMLGPDGAQKKFKIIGVRQAASAFGGMGRNVQVLVPYTCVQRMSSNLSKISSLQIMTVTKDDTETTGNAVLNLLESRHRNHGRNIYAAGNMLAILNQVNIALATLTLFIAAVAGISLLVGGIGVMNIMLVSVTERTREIGIRKAIGAKTKNILVQFLTESSIITLIGGLIGMTTGISAALVIGIFAGIEPTITAPIVIGTIIFSSAIGLFFGIYPARKAAKLNPIDALRYE